MVYYSLILSMEKAREGEEGGDMEERTRGRAGGSQLMGSDKIEYKME